MPETLADAAAELAALKRVLEEGQDGASDEWIASVIRAIRLAETRVRLLEGPDDRSDPSTVTNVDLTEMVQWAD